MIKEDPSQATIMVVDDSALSLELIAEMLKRCGYRVVCCKSCDRAREVVQREVPDLILLDIQMPGMDGIECCRRLKQEDGLGEIPILFISALSEAKDKVRAFLAGGLDYVTKPFEFEEVRERVATHLRLNRQKRELQAAYERIREVEGLRDNLFHMIVHDMRNQLAIILGELELATEDLAGFTRNGVTVTLATANEMNSMIEALLDVNRIEAGKMPIRPQPLSMRDIAEHAIDDSRSMTRSRRIAVSLSGDSGEVTADPDLMRRVLANLIGNAIKFSPSDSRVRVEVESAGEQVCVRVQDSGMGIPAEFQQRIFEKFGQIEARRDGVKHSTGLGLTFCKMAVEAHGGTMGVESVAGEGSTFWFRLGRG